MEEHHTRARLLPLGIYSKALVIPKWWLRLNGEPEIVDIRVTLQSIHIEPVKEGKEVSAHAKKSGR